MKTHHGACGRVFRKPATWIALFAWIIAGPLFAIEALGGETYNFRVILVGTGQEAEMILKRLRAGDPFWKWAMDRSTFPNSRIGGYVEGADASELRREFRETLRTLSPGQISQIVPVEGKFAILKREPQTPARGVWKKADEAYQQALRLAAKGDFPSAQEMAAKAYSLYPSHQAARFVLRISEAVLEKRLDRSLTLQILESILLMQEGFSEKAQKRLERLARANPKTWEISIALGEVYMVTGQASKAIAAYERTLSDPTWAILANLYLGAIYLRQTNLSKALSHYQTVVMADMGIPEAHIGLGLVYLGMKKPNEAIREFQVALAIDPRSDPAYNQMGIVYLSQGNIQQAIWAFEKALSIRPDHVSYLAHLGFAYNQLGMFDKAVKILEKALALAPKDALVHNNLAIAYFDNGQMEKAIDHADQAVKMGYRVHPDFLAKLKPYRKKKSGSTR